MITHIPNKKLSHDIIGYHFIKRYNKKSHSVLIEIWQHVGNNVGSTTANSWKLISSKWQDNNDHQFKSPNDHIDPSVYSRCGPVKEEGNK